MALSAKQQQFINEYLIDFNATRAAERAGYRGPATTLAVTGSDLLRNPNIAKAISTRLSETAMAADEVLMRLAEQARGDMGDFLTSTGELDLTTAIANGRSKLLKKVTQKRSVRTRGDDDVTEEIVTSIELYDAQAALKLLGDNHALFKGNQDSPQHVVVHSHEEWEADYEKRQQQAAAALADFDDDE